MKHFNCNLTLNWFVLLGKIHNAKTTFADEGENLVARDIHVRIVQIGRHVIRQIQLSRSQKMFH